MEKLHILNKIVPNYAENFLGGIFANTDMPLTEAYTEQVKDKVQAIPLQNVALLACQHMLGPQVVLFQKLIDLGLPPRNIFILPKVYSANTLIMAELERMGCNIFREATIFDPSISFDESHNNHCRTVVKTLLNYKDFEKVFVLDDGGMLIKACFSNELLMKQYKGKLYGIEQTSSGKNILLNSKKLPFPVFSVASSREKLEIETDYITEFNTKRILEYLDNQGVKKDARILVLGQGAIGKTQKESLSAKYLTYSYDKKEGQFPYEWKSFDVIIGATGSNSVTKSTMNMLKEGCHLISVSSGDREFPAVCLRRSNNRSGGVHETFYDPERKIYLANAGFPITFHGNTVECEPIHMDVTMFKLLEGIIHGVTRRVSVETTINYLRLQKVFTSSFFPRLEVLIMLVFFILSAIITHLIFGKITLEQNNLDPRLWTPLNTEDRLHAGYLGMLTLGSIVVAQLFTRVWKNILQKHTDKIFDAHVTGW